MAAARVLCGGIVLVGRCTVRHERISPLSYGITVLVTCVETVVNLLSPNACPVIEGLFRPPDSRSLLCPP